MTTSRFLRAGVAALAAAASVPALAQERGRSEPPPHFGPSYQSPYQFAPPAPIYPTPGGSAYDTPYQGANGYAQQPAAPPAPSRNARPSQRLDTRIGPSR